MSTFPLVIQIRLKYRKLPLVKEFAAEVDQISPEVYPELMK